MTSRQILGRQMDRNGINQLRLKIIKKERNSEKAIQKANFLYHISPVRCQTLNISWPLSCDTNLRINIELSATF